MVLTTIAVTNFRNLEKESFTFSPRLTLIIGENARGKTSILESVYFAIFGTGFRELREEELIKWKSDQALVEALFADKNNKQLFQIALRNLGHAVDKRYFVNKTHKSHQQYVQYQTKAVLFAPEHILIIIGSPDKRREYLNKTISAYDFEYLKKLRNFENALRKRNKILEIHHNRETLDEELDFWNSYLIEQASCITTKRQEYIDYLNKHQKVNGRKFRIEYHKNEFTQERLADVYNEEKRLRRTVIGPQKDDFTIHLSGEKEEENVHLYGSRSEQRLSVFWLKLNEIQYLEDTFNIKPLLLLDDIFSELDTKNKKLVLDIIGDYQTIATSTEADLPELTKLPKSVIEL